jgi:hypothetical protein
MPKTWLATQHLLRENHKNEANKALRRQYHQHYGSEKRMKQTKL